MVRMELGVLRECTRAMRSALKAESAAARAAAQPAANGGLGVTLDAMVYVISRSANLTARFEGRLWTMAVCYLAYRGYQLWAWIDEVMRRLLGRTRMES